MRQVAQSLTLAVILVGLPPVAAQAQLLRSLWDPCGTCRHPANQCACVPPVTVAPAVTVAPPVIQPVVETTYRQELHTTFQDVPHVEYRAQAKVETVPVTTYRQQIVDEGHYAKVWVPKLVTKHVPETTYQQRVACETVPYQTTRRVARTETRLVPQQTVRHIARPAAVACDPCGPGYPAVGAMLPSIPAATAFAAPPLETAANVPVPDPLPDPEPLSPSATSSYDDWSEIQPRSGIDSLTEGLGDVSPPRPRTTSRAAGKFVPAPSAARVWNSATFRR